MKAIGSGLLGVTLFLGVLAVPPARAAPPTGARGGDVEFFEARVRPLLVKHCLACHSQKVAQGGLRLDRAEGVRRGGVHGPAIVPGKPDESRLIQAVGYSDQRLQMPPSGKLSDAEIQILTRWVEAGAAWPVERMKTEGGRAPGRMKDEGGVMKGRKAGLHWAFRPLVRGPAPKVRNRSWVKTPLDAFILAKLEGKGLSPAPPADRRTLIRRVTFDLLGLPPSPEDIESFVNDRSPDAYPRLVARLLQSPHYGERWGRHWLDLVRYCDVPEAWAQTEAQPWRYRDWVVKALNDDLPYDQFVMRQLAADEMPDTRPDDLAALGLLGLSPTYWKELKLAPDVIKAVVAEEWEERIQTVTGTILGLTVACARCHDHKSDPITQKDYYALAGIFASTRLTPRPLLPADAAHRVLAARKQAADLDAEAKRLDDEAKAAKESARAGMLRQQASDARARADTIRKSTPDIDAPTVYAVDTASLAVLPDGPDRTRLDYQAGAGQDVALQVRGSPASPGPMVPRRFPAVLSSGRPAPFTHGSGRRELGEAMFRNAAPLTSRVIVNRVWRHHFGRGLVDSPSNFGLLGDRPSHPALLDDLAAGFIRSGWSIKWLHRQMVLSGTYQQSSPSRPQVAESLFGRMSRRRLEVEAWRDAILSAAGTLDPRTGGPPEELGSPSNGRRTLYGTVKRRELDDLLRLYDFPDPTAHSPARFHTTTPLQQLYLLNSDFIGRQASALRSRVQSDVPSDPAGQVRRAYLLLYGRAPSAREQDAAREFLGDGAPAEERWKQYLEVLLARNELMFVD